MFEIFIFFIELKLARYAPKLESYKLPSNFEKKKIRIV